MTGLLHDRRRPRRRGAAIAASLATLTVLLAMVTIGCGESASSILIPQPDTTKTEGSTGESLYRFHCSACHGVEGRPLVASTDDLRDYDESFEAFDSVLTTGPGTMPMYPGLDSAERRLIYAHVRDFTR
jgi:mono/diheme cytochrome c family protein